MRARILILFGACLFVASAQVIAQEPSADVNVRSLMTAEQFQRAGLHKLTPSELAALDEWFVQIAHRLLAASPSPSVSVPTPSRALDFSSLEGAIIVADDGEFLGKITTNAFDLQSIGNEFGRYGSSVGRTSIFNEVGRYGGEVARMSPFNAVTSVPPRIYKGDRFIAYLTVNSVKSPRVDPRALIGWIKANQ